MRILRRDFLRGASAAAGLLAMPGIVRAQSRELIVCGPGNISTLLRDEFFPKFEEKFNCSVLYEGSNSLTNLQKMRADPSRPPMSVVMMDDPVMVTAFEEDLIEPVTAEMVPNMSRLLPRAIHAEGGWINYQQPRAAIGVNTDNAPEGVDSWTALWDPQFAGRVAIPSLELTQGVWTLIAAAQIATGLPMDEALQNIDAGFEKLIELRPNLLMIYNQSSQALQLLETGEVTLLGGESAHSILPRKENGIPVDLARPQEGSFAMPSGMALVTNAPERELALQYIDEFLSDDYQYLVAEKLHSNPTVPDAPVPPGFERDSNLIVPDWFYITHNREAWIERWARTIGRS